jgi:hypothetical protein
MTTKKQREGSASLRAILEGNSNNNAEDILKKIRDKNDPTYTADRKKNQKFVEEYVKGNGKLKYFKEDWHGTRVWKDAFDDGYSQATYELEEHYQKVIMNLVNKLTV